MPSRSVTGFKRSLHASRQNDDKFKCPRDCHEPHIKSGHCLRRTSTGQNFSNFSDDADGEGGLSEDEGGNESSSDINNENGNEMTIEVPSKIGQSPSAKPIESRPTKGLEESFKVYGDKGMTGFLRKAPQLEPWNSTASKSIGQQQIMDESAVFGVVEDMDPEIFHMAWENPASFKDMPPEIGLGNSNIRTRLHVVSSTDDSVSEASFDDEEPSLHPFFEDKINDIMLQNPSSEGDFPTGANASSDAELYRYLFSSDSSKELSDIGAFNERMKFKEDHEDSDSDVESGETTDEDLDMTAADSNQRQSSTLLSWPQNLHPQCDGENDGSPLLFSWVVDPERPICIVEGAKKTFMVPNNIAVTSKYSGTYHPFNVFLGSNDSEDENVFPPRSMADNIFDCTEPVDSGKINPTYPSIQPFEEEDPYESRLEIQDFVAFSESDSDSGIDASGSAANLRDSDSCVETSDSVLSMLERWDQVSVTAFRKRQLQHVNRQKLPISNSEAFGGHRSRELRFSDTISSHKKRRIRNKFLASRGGKAVTAAGTIKSEKLKSTTYLQDKT